MGYRKQVKQAVQLFFRTHSQQLVHLPDIFGFRLKALVYIQNQGFQQVHFRIIPEVIPFGRTGILDDDISKYLCHAFSRPVNPTGNTLKNGVTDIGPALHGSAGTVDCHIPIHIGVVGQADGLAVQLA